MSSNRLPAVAFVVLAISQTAAPVIAQKLTHAIVIRHFLHGAIIACVAAAIVVTVLQVLYRPFRWGAMIGFHLGATLLVFFDILVEQALNDSC